MLSNLKNLVPQGFCLPALQPYGLLLDPLAIGIWAQFFLTMQVIAV